MAGDVDKEIKILSTLGQATGFSPKGSSLIVGKATHDAIPSENCAMVGDHEVHPLDLMKYY